VSEPKEIAVAEQPQQLITIEPAKYVALVFESFRKKFDTYKAEADKVTYDIATTAGMKTAVEWRAKFRDEIRIATENARKERKAPILEIGRLLDSKAKEIVEEAAPYEARFDRDIKAEEKRKDDEKIAKALAESARISAIRSKIAEMQAIPSMLVGKSSETIAAAMESLEAAEITLETHAEFAGESEMVKAATVLKVSAMLEAQKDHEAEAARIAAERAQLERERAEAAERERIAAAARAEQERKDREAREAEERRLRAEREAHEAELRRQREAEGARLAAERERAEAEMRAQREELARQQAEIDRQRAEAERVERERREAIEAEERRQREEAEAAARAEAERIEAERLAEERAEAERARAEQQRAENERRAAEAEAERRAQAQFEANGPEPDEIIQTIADRYDVSTKVAGHWLGRHVWMEIAA